MKSTLLKTKRFTFYLDLIDMETWENTDYSNLEIVLWSSANGSCVYSLMPQSRFENARLSEIMIDTAKTQTILYELSTALCLRLFEGKYPLSWSAVLTRLCQRIDVSVDLTMNLVDPDRRYIFF